MIRTRTTGIAAMIVGIAASTLLISAPAHAAAYTPGDPITVGGTTWTVNGTQLTAAAISLGNPFLHTEFGDGAGAPANCLDPELRAPDDNGDVTLVCSGVSPVDGVSTLAQWTFFTEGDLARQIIIVRNSSDSAKPLVWTMNFQFDAAVSGNFPQATSTQPTLAARNLRPLVLTDTWTYNDSRAAILNAAMAWGHPTASVPHTSALSGPTLDQIASDPSSTTMIQPNQIALVAFYYKIDLAGSTLPTDQINVSAITNEFATFDGRLVRGLPEGAIVQNWGTVPASDSPQTPVAPPAPELAETGPSDSELSLGLLALGGLLVGGALLVTRRRRTETVAAV